MDKEKFLKLYNNIFPLGVLNDLSFEDFCNKLKAYADEEYPNSNSFLSGDKELPWWIILHECFEYLNTSFTMGDKWAAEDFFWNVNRLLGGLHKYSIIYNEEDSVTGSIEIEYEWDGVESSVSLEDYFDTSISQSINKILDDQENPYLIIQYGLSDGEEIYYFRIKNDQVRRFRELWENPFITFDGQESLSKESEQITTDTSVTYRNRSNEFFLQKAKKNIFLTI